MGKPESESLSSFPTARERDEPFGVLNRLNMPVLGNQSYDCS